MSECVSDNTDHDHEDLDSLLKQKAVAQMPLGNVTRTFYLKIKVQCFYGGFYLVAFYQCIGDY